MEYLSTHLGFSLSKVTTLALDVTYEGFEQKKFYTIENDYLKKSMQNTIINTAYKINHPFLYVPSKQKIPALVKKEDVKGVSWFDEGAAYYRYAKGVCSASICIPCGNGDMHSERGVEIEYPVFAGYIKNLKMLIDASLGKDAELLSCKEEIDALSQMEEIRKKEYEEYLASLPSFTQCEWDDFYYEDDLINNFLEYVNFIVPNYEANEDGYECFLVDISFELAAIEDCIDPTLYNMDTVEEVIDTMEIYATEIFMEYHEIPYELDE